MVLAGVVCHIAVRFLAPYADPVLLPAVVALNGIGLAMIRRIDLGSDTSLAGQQIIWAGLSRRRLLRHARPGPRPPSAAGLHLHVRVRRHRTARAPAASGDRHVRSTAHASGCTLGSLSFQPGEIAKICLAIFFAGYLVVKRDALALAGRRFIGIDLPRGRDLGPDPADVAGQPRRPRLPARPRLVAALLRPVRGAALRRDRAAELAGRRRAALPRRRLLRLPALRTRPGARRRLARPFDPARPDHARASTAWPGAASSAAAGARARPTSRRSRTPTSSPPRSARSSA